MIVSFLSENLQKKISFLNRIISGRSQLPVLSNFLITAEKGKLKISATDLEIGAIIETQASIEKEGETTVPAKTFSELVANIPEGKITLELKDGRLNVSGKNIKTVFQTIPAEEFPKLYDEKDTEKIAVLDKEKLEKDLLKIVFAASVDTDRPALSGVLIKEDKEGVLMVATDAHRLSIKTDTAAGVKKGGAQSSFLISARTLRELIAMPTDGEISFSVSGKNNQVIFAEKDITLIGRLIDAEYPNYEKIIPTDSTTRAEFDRNQMQNAVKICSVFAREAANAIKFSVKKDGITVSASTPPLGENTVEVPAKTTGEENEIAFNSRYLLEFLESTDEEDIIFEMTGPLNPGVFKIKNDKNFLHLIMPIRLVRDEELG